MSKKSDIIRIWQECFPADSAQWRRMFFDAAYVDEEALTEVDSESGTTVSSLLLLPYSMSFLGRSLGAGYVYGAGTLKRFRARGHMGALIRRALKESADRGDSLVVLIPASPLLRGYYGRFGFSNVFYRLPERYTSIHRFAASGRYEDVSATAPAKLFDDFERLMGERDYCIQHSRSQFLTLMEDARLSEYAFAAVSREGSGGEVCAMAWGKPDAISDEMLVSELLAEDDDCAKAVLDVLHAQMPDRPVTILRKPDNDWIGGNSVPYGMARIVNPESFLGAIAERFPKLTLTVRLTDDILPENSGIYTLRDGRLTVANDSEEGRRRANLDVNALTLASLLFSSHPIAEITGLPASRPHMSLMLD